MTDQKGAYEPNYRASDDPRLQPFTDPVTGEVVTLTPSHCNAIFAALDVWLAVVSPSDQRNALLREQVVQARAALGFIHAKSCLLGRLLYDGKPPLVDPPPLADAAPDYRVEVTEPSLAAYKPEPSEDVAAEIAYGGGYSGSVPIPAQPDLIPAHATPPERSCLRTAPMQGEMGYCGPQLPSGRRLLTPHEWIDQRDEARYWCPGYWHD